MTADEILRLQATLSRGYDPNAALPMHETGAERIVRESLESAPRVITRVMDDGVKTKDGAA